MDNNARLREELKLKRAENKILAAQRDHALSQLHTLKSLSQIIVRLLRIAKLTNDSMSWRIGKAVVDFVNRISLKKTKPGFIYEAKGLEREFVRLSSESSFFISGLANTEGQSSAKKVLRQYQSFDLKKEKITKKELCKYLSENKYLNDVLVSIVMPTHNRADCLPRSIGSVIEQTHTSWELIVIDDGSTDLTSDVMQSFLEDPRIKYRSIEKNGVGEARNVGLEMATGDVIAFLDSDNQWFPDYLSLVVSSIYQHDVSVVFAGLELVKSGKVVGYRGEKFDFASCYEGNYIDLNCFAHKRELFPGQRFDTELRRYNDWDYILQSTRNQQVEYLPFRGAIYHIESVDDQISNTEPKIFRKIVKYRYANIRGNEAAQNQPAHQIIPKLDLSFGIRVSPKNQLIPTYDYDIGTALSKAFIESGYSSQVFHSNDSFDPESFDVIISVQGIESHKPVKGCVNVVWSVGDPALLELEQIDKFDIILIASRSMQKMVELALRRTVHYLPNCVDEHYAIAADQDKQSSNTPYLYIGNAIGESTTPLKYAMRLNLPISIYGSDWIGTEQEPYVEASYIPAERAVALYRSGSVLLFGQKNAEYEYVDKVFFDALIFGAKIIAKSSSELESLFPGEVNTFDTFESFQSCIDVVANSKGESDLASVSDYLLTHHSYKNRVSSIIGFIANNIANIKNEMRVESLEAVGLTSQASLKKGRLDHKALRIAFLPQITKGSRWSSSGFLRVVHPLTSAGVNELVDLTCYDSVTKYVANANNSADLVIVSRTAIGKINQAEEFIGLLQKNGTPFVLDLDDGLHEIEPSHPEFEYYRERVDTLKMLIGAATEVWCATENLNKSVALSTDKVVLIKNSLDPRLWKVDFDKYRLDRPNSKAQILYMGTHTHQEDLLLVIPALDRLAENFRDSFELTVIGVSTNAPQRKWLNVITPPASETEYPRFSRWMRGQAGKYDIGIAPLVDNRFNQLKSELKILEYVALGMVVVASNVGAYQINNMAIICDSVSDWYDELEKLVADQEFTKFDSSKTTHNRRDLWSTCTSAMTGYAMLEQVNKIVGTQQHGQNPSAE